MSKYVIFQFVVSYTAKLSVWRTGDGAHSLRNNRKKQDLNFWNPVLKFHLIMYVNLYASTLEYIANTDRGVDPGGWGVMTPENI